MHMGWGNGKKLTGWAHLDNRHYIRRRLSELGHVNIEMIELVPLRLPENNM